MQIKQSWIRKSRLWIIRIKKLFRPKIPKGSQQWLDRIIFEGVSFINELSKTLSPKFLKDWVYRQLLKYLLQIHPVYSPSLPWVGEEENHQLFLEYKKKRFLAEVEPCDVILVKGNQRVSRIIQTLTQSPYSHATIYIGDGKIVEAEPEGVLISSIEKYIELDLRICRPALLTEKGKEIVLQHIGEKLKQQPKYDIANLEKLFFKYVYLKFRPDAQIYIGGNTKFESYYLCSGLIAHAFHKARYPIIPSLKFRKRVEIPSTLEHVKDYFDWISHQPTNYSQIVPADFDNSSFFTAIKFLCIENHPSVRKRRFH